MEEDEYFDVVRESCERKLFNHVKVGMGYNYIPDDLEDVCDWTQSKWNPVEPKRVNLMVQMSRDSYKSTSLTQSLPSYFLSQNPNLSILIISKVFGNAKNFLIAQRQRFESDEFKEIFGYWKTSEKLWAEERITIRNRTIHRKEPSIMVGGLGSEFTSLHFDVIIADDITTKRDMYSPVERKATERLYKSLFDIVDKRRGLLLIIGTSWHEEDVLQKIKESNEDKRKAGLDDFKIYFRPAEHEVDGEMKYNFSFLTPKILNQIRIDKADLRDYCANYQLTPLPDSEKIFSEFEYFNYNDYIKSNKIKLIVQYTDPSLGETKKSDYSAIVTVAKDESNHILVLDVDMKRRKPSELIKAVGNSFVEYDEWPVIVYPFMETVAFQEFLRDEAVNKLLLENKVVPIKGFKQTKNKIARITALERYTTSGIIKFRSDWKDFPDYRLLMKQLKNFPLDDHDDGPDALEGAVTIAIKKGSAKIRTF